MWSENRDQIRCQDLTLEGGIEPQTFWGASRSITWILEHEIFISKIDWQWLIVQERYWRARSVNSHSLVPRMFSQGIGILPIITARGVATYLSSMSASYSRCPLSWGGSWKTADIASREARWVQEGQEANWWPSQGGRYYSLHLSSGPSTPDTLCYQDL